MHIQAKVIKAGNSWAIRLPRAALELSELKPDSKLDIEIKPGRLTLRDPDQVKQHEIDQAYQDAKATWDQLMQDAWELIFGPNDEKYEY